MKMRLYSLFGFCSLLVRSLSGSLGGRVTSKVGNDLEEVRNQAPASCSSPESFPGETEMLAQQKSTNFLTDLRHGYGTLPELERALTRTYSDSEVSDFAEIQRHGAETMANIDYICEHVVPYRDRYEAYGLRELAHISQQFRRIFGLKFMKPSYDEEEMMIKTLRDELTTGSVKLSTSRQSINQRLDKARAWQCKNIIDVQYKRYFWNTPHRRHRYRPHHHSDYQYDYTQGGG
ncbi:hypothetical protein PGT21_011988 [Puccinia graminis f. sp. tritici]|uniref:Secreted protein n=1 Tax=Puccinia graminis f. sp. tritici TaxID=56615 RepID=A0A5B0PEZ1_PUCGR|nr:hypothetical protein PGT21_011988 [Puccinia graminis f. sp. tritici]